ncbi:unnamed protein product [Amoebophrya sp. A25]|nr:unnamed protein product [Amoebophrya sp. A25]|eukprot:GSA25T00016295001.1
MPRSSKRKYERSCSCKAGAVALTSSSTTVSLVGQTVVVSGKENLRGSASFCQSASCGESAGTTEEVNAKEAKEGKEAIAAKAKEKVPAKAEADARATQLDEAMQPLKEMGEQVEKDVSSLKKIMKERLDPSLKDRFGPLSGNDTKLLYHDLDTLRQNRDKLFAFQKEWLQASSFGLGKTGESAIVSDKLKLGQQYSDKATEYGKAFDAAYIAMVKDITERAVSSVAESRNTLESYKNQLGENVADSFDTLDAEKYVDATFALPSAGIVLGVTEAYASHIKKAVKFEGFDASEALMTAQEELLATLEKERGELEKVRSGLMAGFREATENMKRANSTLFDAVQQLRSAFTNAAQDLEDLTHAVDEEEALKIVRDYFERKQEVGERVVSASEAAAKSIKPGKEKEERFMRNLCNQYEKMVKERLENRVKQMQEGEDSPQKRALDAYDKARKPQKAAASFLEEVPF